jgi:hypothetical protein
MTPERWLPVPGYDGMYDVSDRGRVRSWYPWRGNSVPRILAPQLNNYLYDSFSLCLNGVNVRRKAHHLVLLAFVGPRPEGMETRHLDGNPRNNSLSNLAYGTHTENMQDKIRHGTNSGAEKTHCVHGHLYDEANTYRHPVTGWRWCNTCRRARWVPRADRKKVLV